MNAIVVTDKQWAIGRSGDLLFSLPGDMKHFRTLTTGGTVIMGRKTLDSFPGGRPLPKRRNIVITRSPDFHREGCETVSTPEDALALAGDEENVWLIGGGSIYAAGPLPAGLRHSGGQHRIGCRHLFPRSGRPP